MSGDPQQTGPDTANTDDASATSGTSNDTTVPWREEQLREARRRALIWGVGGGLLMSVLLVGACILLILAADA